MTILLVLILFVLLFGGVSYGYGAGGKYPYRSYSMPGAGTLLVVLLVLYLLGVFR
jgi:hypothetical protein